MRAVLLPMPALMPSTASHCGIFHSPPTRSNHGPCRRARLPPKDIFSFSSQTTECVTRYVFPGKRHQRREHSPLALGAVLSKVLSNYCFQSCVSTALQMPKHGPRSITGGLPQIDEKVPCSRPVNRYLINGVGRPERRYCLCTNTHCTFATGCEPRLTGA